jgi:chromate reductase, NAD(P)H dehydrogenase (quinone)
MTKKVGIIIGSSRTGSNTAKVARAIKRELENAGITDILVPDAKLYDIPFFNKGGVDFNQMTDYQNQVYNAMANSDIIFFLSPEYNWTMSAEILNLFHQFGSTQFATMWEGKTIAFAGVSAGRGGRIPAIDMSRVVSKLIGFFGFKTIVSPKIFESQLTPQVLEDNGDSKKNEAFDKGLKDFVLYHL